MQKKIFIMLMVLCTIILYLGCDGNDPNEPGVPDGIDFKSSSVTHDREDVTSDIVFYSSYSGDEFFYYYSVDDYEDAEYLVRCRNGSFTVSKESTPNSGIFDVVTYTGTSVVTGSNYHLEFPLSALDLDGEHEWSIQYWFFEIAEQDRMPDSGFKSLSNIP